MFSVSLTFSQLSAVAVATYQASSEVAVPMSSGPISVLSFWKELGLDDAVWDTVEEAALALAVFGLASAVLTAYRKGSSKSSRSQKSKLGSQAPQLPALKRAGRSRMDAAPRGLQCSDAAPVMRPAPMPRPTARGSQTEADALVSAVRAGKAAQLPRLLDGALARSLAVASNLQSPATEEHVATALLHSALRACAANRCFDDAIAAYEHMARHISSANSGPWSVLLYCIVEAGAFGKCKPVFENLCRQGDPSCHDFVNMVRCYSARQDADGLRELLVCFRASGQVIDNYTQNRALAVCGSSDAALHLAESLMDSGICAEGLDAVGYNTLMKYSARAGQFSRCFDLHTEMKAKHVEASEVTFGILLDACVDAKELECAKKVFDDLCASGLQLNVVHCTTFIKSLLGADKLDEAATVLREMANSSGVKPDLISYSTVVKAYANAGDVLSAVKILQEMIQARISPDEIIFNSVLTACCVFPVRSHDVMRTFDTLIGLGMRPSTTTLSILLKALVHTQAWTTSLQVINDAPQTFHIEPEVRLYVQLAQACVKDRATAEVVEIFDAMLTAVRRRSERVDPTIVSRLLRCCILSGDHKVAAKLCGAAQRAGVVVEAHIEKMMSAASVKRSSVSKISTCPAAPVKASPAGSLTGSLSCKSTRPPWMKARVV